MEPFSKPEIQFQVFYLQKKKSHQNAYKIFREMIKRRQLINLIKEEEEFENV